MKELILNIASIADNFAGVGKTGYYTEELKFLGVDVEIFSDACYGVRMNDIQIVFGLKQTPSITFFNNDHCDIEFLTGFVKEFEDKFEQLIFNMSVINSYKNIDRYERIANIKKELDHILFAA
jgi:hypothetical protein